MVVNNVTLKNVAVTEKQYPEDNKPEIAFVGRSNVGKSSLINTMINRKALARTSQNPGKTRTINFYEIEELLYFVDLPGYGYAKASKSEVAKWGKMIEDYLINRKQLKVIIQLIDIRHEPGANDLQMVDWLSYYNINMIIALTKSDKLTRNQLNKNISMIKKTLNLDKNVPIVPFSSVEKTGRDELWSLIENQIQEK